MNCPLCLEAMTPVPFNGIQVDRCQLCGGLYFDATELNRLLVVQGAEALDSGALTTSHELGERRSIYCPRCLERGHRTRMITLVDADQPAANFDRCPACGGSFFDAGKFQALKHHAVADFARDLPPRVSEAKGARI